MRRCDVLGDAMYDVPRLSTDDRPGDSAGNEDDEEDDSDDEPSSDAVLCSDDWRENERASDSSATWLNSLASLGISLSSFVSIAHHAERYLQTKRQRQRSIHTYVHACMHLNECTRHSGLLLNGQIHIRAPPTQHNTTRW
jgi:hypothetical protein